jgi:hypothetical protein
MNGWIDGVVFDDVVDHDDDEQCYLSVFLSN